MADKKIYRSSITGQIVTKKFAKDNPDTTQKETIHNHRALLMEFCQFVMDNSLPLDSVTIDKYLKKK